MKRFLRSRAESARNPPLVESAFLGFLLPKLLRLLALLGYLPLAVALSVVLRSNISVAASLKEIVLRTRECLSW
jgi:hypothetical protein